MAFEEILAGKRDAASGDVPFDPRLLSAAEARYKELEIWIRPPRTGSLEVTEAAPAAQPPLRRREAVRRLLRSNPSGAIARRIQRIRTRGDAQETQPGSFAGESLTVAESSLPSDASEPDFLERIIGRDELLGIQYLDGGQAASRSVARIVIRRGTTVRSYGTGSLISPRLLITNNHVLPSEDDARDSTVEFNFQDDVQGQPVTPVRFRLQPDVFFVTSALEELDFTVVAVALVAEDDTTPLSQFGFTPPSALTDEIVAGESVTIIQHPGGDRKKIARARKPRAQVP